MTYQPTTISDDLNNLPKLQGWVITRRAETLETVGFRSGAALTVLDQLVSDPRHGVPVKLLANRLALSAATATSKLEGRLAREVDIRDAYHLTSPGEARGPDGDLLAFWRDRGRLRPNGPGEIADLIGSERAEDVVGCHCTLINQNPPRNYPAISTRLCTLNFRTGPLITILHP